MRRIFLSSVLCLFFAHFNAAFAENLFRVVLPSTIEPTMEAQIKQGLKEAISGREIQIVLHKAKTPQDDRVMFQRVLKQTSTGIIVVVDKPNWGTDSSGFSWAQEPLQRHSGSPLLSVGLVDVLTGFNARIGATTQDYADLAATFLNQKQDTLCLFTTSRQWCDMLTSSIDGVVISRSVVPDQAVSMQMAAMVSAMTQNPNITQIVASDSRLLPSLKQALTIIGDSFTIGSIGDSAEAEANFVIDGQWLLQTALAVQALEVWAKHNQQLRGVLSVPPVARD